MAAVAQQTDIQSLANAARDALREERWNDAVELWQQVSGIDATFSEAYAGCGLALIKAGRRGEAVESLRLAVAGNPGDQKSLNRLAALAAMNTAAPSDVTPTAAIKATRTQRDTIGEVMALAREFGFSPGTIVDVGVNTGTPGLYDDFPNAKYLLIDPVAENEVFMKHMCSTLKDGRYVIAAAGPEAGFMTLSVHPGIGGSRLVDAVGRHSDGEDREVKVVTLDDFSADNDAEGPFVIKVDVEGAELAVLAGAERILSETEILILETRLVRIGKAPDLTDTLAFLDARGFAAYDIIDRNYHKVDRTLKQFDLVAVRKNGYFRTDNINRSFVQKPSGDFAARIIAGKLSKRERALEEIAESQSDAPVAERKGGRSATPRGRAATMRKKRSGKGA